MTTPDRPPYIVKPLSITQDSRLSYAEQDYICLIWQLRKTKGCTATNKFFAKYFNVTRPRVSEIISSLKNKGIIQTTETRKGKNITGRTIIIIDEAIKDSLSRCTKKSLRGGIKETTKGGTKETPEDKLNKENKYINIFNKARLLFPGSKLGLETEFKNFQKKNNNWTENVLLLEPAIQKEIQHKAALKNSGQFCPDWKHFQTWINNRCWEQEFPATNPGEYHPHQEIDETEKDKPNFSHSANTVPKKIKKLPQTPPDPEKLKHVMADLGFDTPSSDTEIKE